MKLLLKNLTKYGLFPIVMSSIVVSANYLTTHTTLHPSLITAIVSITALLFIIVAEIINPYSKKWLRDSGDFFVDLGHAIATSTTSRMAKSALYAIFLWPSIILAQRIGHPIWPNSWNIYLQLALAMLIAEFGAYWLHRFMHTYEWGWKFHATHHSSPRLYWLNAARFHPVDVAMSYLFSTTPLILMGANAQAMMLFTVFAGVFGTLQHCNIDLRLGPLNYIFSMAEVHRWHHSKKMVEANNNFGDNLIIWDLVFGTYYNPKNKKASTNIGISMSAFPTDYFGQILSPLKWKQLKEKSKKAVKKYK